MAKALRIGKELLVSLALYHVSLLSLFASFLVVITTSLFNHQHLILWYIPMLVSSTAHRGVLNSTAAKSKSIAS